MTFKAVDVPALVQTVQPVIEMLDGKATTTSAEVARVFDKQHKNVLRDIEKMLPDLVPHHKLNFEPTVVTRENPSGGAPIKSKAYRITRDGFVLLAMGFSGKKALAFKQAYLQAFNQMEAALTERIDEDESPLEAPQRFHRLREDDLRQVTTHRAMRKLGVETHYQTNCVFYTPPEWKSAKVKRWLVTKEKRIYRWQPAIMPASIEPLSPDAVIVERQQLQQWLDSFPFDQTLGLAEGLAASKKPRPHLRLVSENNA